MQNRLKELDGVRGLAILMVMMFHIFKRADYFSNNEYLRFISKLSAIGWAGVDIFFVLSGFLITTILLKTKPEKNYFRNFYARRALRIFPLYYITISILLYILPFTDPERGMQTQGLWPFYYLYQQNWTFITTAPSFLVSVTWSLAIEEQFYLIWPALTYYFNKRQLALISIGIILVSITARIVLIIFPQTSMDPRRIIYFGSLTRFEQLAFGALTALLFSSQKQDVVPRKLLYAICAASISAFAMIAITDNPNPLVSYDLALWSYTLMAIFSATLIITLLIQKEKMLLSSIFKNPILTFFGKYSYSIYLFHLPVTLYLLNVLVKADRQSAKAWLIFTAGCFCVTIIASLLSWNLLEKRALEYKKYFE